MLSASVLKRVALVTWTLTVGSVIRLPVTDTLHGLPHVGSEVITGFNRAAVAPNEKLIIGAMPFVVHGRQIRGDAKVLLPLIGTDSHSFDVITSLNLLHEPQPKTLPLKTIVSLAFQSEIPVIRK